MDFYCGIYFGSNTEGENVKVQCGERDTFEGMFK